MLPSQIYHSLYGNHIHAVASLESCDLCEDKKQKEQTEKVENPSTSFHVLSPSLFIYLSGFLGMSLLIYDGHQLLKCSTFSQWTISQAPFLSTEDEIQIKQERRGKKVSFVLSYDTIIWKSENPKKLIYAVLPCVSFLFTTLSALWRFCKWEKDI